MEYSCRNALAHRHEGWGRRGLKGFYYREGRHRRGTEGEAVAVAVGRCEVVVGEWWNDRASAVYGNPDAAFWVPDPVRPSL